MMFLSEVNVPLIVEIALLIIVLVSAFIVGSAFVIRDLRRSYKELFRHQSKFDIELRKIVNLISKATKNETMAKYDNLVIKDLPYVDKKALLDLIDHLYTEHENESEQFAYVRETYENLQEQRRSLDATILLFNQKISLFPFNLYSKVMKLRKRQYYTHK